jgi:hypothetical protein
MNDKTVIHHTSYIRSLGIVVAKILYTYQQRKGGISFSVIVKPIVDMPDEDKSIFLSSGFLGDGENKKVSAKDVIKSLDIFRENMKITD